MVTDSPGLRTETTCPQTCLLSLTSLCSPTGTVRDNKVLGRSSPGNTGAGKTLQEGMCRDVLCLFAFERECAEGVVGPDS